jgi:hypothetical protein
MMEYGRVYALLALAFEHGILRWQTSFELFVGAALGGVSSF